MDGIVDTHGIPMLCLDTLRYDVNMAGEASRETPALNNYGSGWEERYAPGSFAYPSHFAVLAESLPSPAEPHMSRSRKWLFFPSQTDTGRVPPKDSYVFKEATLVQSLSNIGYGTTYIGGVSSFSKRSDTGRVFPGYLNKSYWLPAFGCADENSAANRVDFAVNKLEKYPADRRVFTYINFSATHYPNCHYVEGRRKDDREPYAVALRYADSQLPRLFEAFGRRSDTLAIALFDHGACCGEDGYKHHCVSHEKVRMVPYEHSILRR